MKKIILFLLFLPSYCSALTLSELREDLSPAATNYLYEIMYTTAPASRKVKISSVLNLGGSGGVSVYPSTAPTVIATNTYTAGQSIILDEAGNVNINSGPSGSTFIGGGGGLTISGATNVGLNCSGNSNGGKLTTDGTQILACSDDVGFPATAVPADLIPAGSSVTLYGYMTISPPPSLGFRTIFNMVPDNSPFGQGSFFDFDSGASQMHPVFFQNIGLSGVERSYFAFGNSAQSTELEIGNQDDAVFYSALGYTTVLSTSNSVSQRPFRSTFAIGQSTTILPTTPMFAVDSITDDYTVFANRFMVTTTNTVINQNLNVSRTISSSYGIASTTGVFTSSISVSGSVMVGSNTILSGATFYQNGPLVISSASIQNYGRFLSSMTLSGNRLVQDKAPTDTQVLAWNAANSWWTPTTASSGGGVSVYNATATIGASFGISGTTAAFTSTVTIGNLLTATTAAFNGSISASNDSVHTATLKLTQTNTANGIEAPLFDLNGPPSTVNFTSPFVGPFGGNAMLVSGYAKMNLNGSPIMNLDGADRELYVMLGYEDCFDGKTKVFTPKGYRNIEDIKTGDKVWSMEPLSKSLYVNEVGEAKTHPKGIIRLIINEKIRTNYTHTFYANGQWIRSIDLKIGDWLLNKEGQKVWIYSLETVDHPQVTYNLHMKNQNLANYLILAGEETILVHNKCPFLYYFNPDGKGEGAWEYQTTFLYNLDSPEKKTVQRRKLKKLSNKFVIRELEPETSYIQKLALIAVTNKGEVRLRQVNAKPLITKQGDVIPIEFESLPKNTKELYIEAEGYYVAQ